MKYESKTEYLFRAQSILTASYYCYLTDDSGIGFYEITLLFDSEEEMTEAFDKLVEEGYNCRMSDS